LVSAYATTVGFTIANPATILSFAAAFMGLGLAGHSAAIAAALVLGSSPDPRLVDRPGGLRIGLPKPPRPAGLRRMVAGSSVLIGLLGGLAIAASLAA